jgi:ethanolamine utilization protein EutN
MILAVVEGHVVSTIKNKNYEGKRLMIIQPLDIDGSFSGEKEIAIDHVNSGTGDLVLCTKEGGGAQIMMESKDIPLQTVIMGIVDGIEYKV